MLAEWNQAHIQDALSQENISWKFLPPAASHMGEAWECLVGTVKRALKVVIGTQTLTDEVLVTALTEVEGMVNGRPLTYISSGHCRPFLEQMEAGVCAYAHEKEQVASRSNKSES